MDIFYSTSDWMRAFLEHCRWTEAYVAQNRIDPECKDYRRGPLPLPMMEIINNSHSVRAIRDRSSTTAKPMRAIATKLLFTFPTISTTNASGNARPPRLEAGLCPLPDALREVESASISSIG
jgi:hypothetical protein